MKIYFAGRFLCILSAKGKSINRRGYIQKKKFESNTQVVLFIDGINL